MKNPSLYSFFEGTWKKVMSAIFYLSIMWALFALIVYFKVNNDSFLALALTGEISIPVLAVVADLFLQHLLLNEADGHKKRFDAVALLYVMLFASITVLAICIAIALKGGI